MKLLTSFQHLLTCLNIHYLQFSSFDLILEDFLANSKKSLSKCLLINYSRRQFGISPILITTLWLCFTFLTKSWILCLISTQGDRSKVTFKLFYYFQVKAEHFFFTLVNFKKKISNYNCSREIIKLGGVFMWKTVL